MVLNKLSCGHSGACLLFLESPKQITKTFKQYKLNRGCSHYNIYFRKEETAQLFYSWLFVYALRCAYTYLASIAR